MVTEPDMVMSPSPPAFSCWGRWTTSSRLRVGVPQRRLAAGQLPKGCSVPEQEWFNELGDLVG